MNNAVSNAIFSDSDFTLPKQFDPKRIIEDGPFGVWVERTLARAPDLTMADIQPTKEDLALISQLAFRNDDLGNNLAEVMLKDRSLAQQFDKGLKEGIDSLDNPPQELVDYLSYYENIPDWAYLKDLESFQKKYPNSINPDRSGKKPFPDFLIDGVAMAAGFFVGANYPAVGQSLVATGSVASGSGRMVQTMQYVDDMAYIDDFNIFGKAIQSNAKVRLAHAFARRQIEKSGMWDKNYYGEIISDFDNMIFLSGITLQEDFLSGVDLSERALEAIRIKAKAMQYLLGAPQELVTMPLDQNKRFFIMVVAHLDDSPDTAKQVVQNFRDNAYFRPAETPLEKVSKEMAFLTANMVTRVSWGNTMANSIGMDRFFYGLYLPPIAEAIAKPPQAVRRLLPFLMGIAENLLNNYKGINRITSKLPKPKIFNRKNETESNDKNYKGSYGMF